MNNLRWLPIDVRMETGTKVEILRLPVNHACCGTILHAAVLNPPKKTNMALPFNNRASSGEFTKLSA